MKIIKLDLFGSHIPILVKILEKTNGKILELGMGLSTIVMHTMAAQTKRPIVSYESNKEWYEESLKYKSDFHQIEFVDNWDDADIDNEFWDVVLVDHWTDRRRVVEVKRLANKANYILLHDSDIFDKFYTQSGIYSLFKYRYDYTKCFPNTVVLSNFKDLSILK
jgi:uncharacterized radical SAM superfamily protein